ncbi:MAG: TlpA disulfide reductase family protein [Rubrivivax sp.]
MMRLDRRRSLAALAGTALGAAAWHPLLAAPAAPGEPVVWPQIRLLDGRAWSAAQADGKAVVAVFWSTTCPFCRRHNAHVEKLRQAAVGQPLELITIARENDPQAVQGSLSRHGWRFAVTLDHAPMAAALSARKLIPLTVTVDRRGRLKQVIPGEMSEDDVLDLLKLST